MDEPTDGLDPNQKHEVRDLLSAMAKDKIIIVSTHILEEVEAVCTRAMIIARGQMLADSTPDELLSRSRYHQAVTLMPPQEPGDWWQVDTRYDHWTAANEGLAIALALLAAWGAE